jgi:hypothetical protein
MSRRVLAASGALGYGTGLALFAATTSFGVLLVAAALLGLASTAMVDAVEVALVDVAGAELEPTLARQNLLGTAGDLLGPLLLITVEALGLSWRVAFAAGAVLLALYGAWLASLPIPPPPPRTDGDTVRAGLVLVARDPRVWVIGLLAVLLVPLDEPFFAFLIATLEDRGLPLALATAVAAFGIIGTLAGFARQSSATARSAPRTLTAAAAVMTAAVAATLVPSTPVVLAAVFAFGVAIAIFWVTLQTRMFSLHPGRAGTVKAVVGTIEITGFALPVLAGAAADAAGVSAGLAVFAGFAALLTLLTTVPTLRR